MERVAFMSDNTVIERMKKGNYTHHTSCLHQKGLSSGDRTEGTLPRLPQTLPLYPWPTLPLLMPFIVRLDICGWMDTNRYNFVVGLRVLCSVLREREACSATRVK